MEKARKPYIIVATAARLVGLFSCMVCLANFTSGANLSRHIQCTGHANPGADDIPLPEERGRRHRYSFRRKRDILIDVYAIESNLSHPYYHCAAKFVALRERISEGCISKWRAKRVLIYECARTRQYRNKKSLSKPGPAHPEAELRLYAYFLIRRRIRGRRVTYAWLQRRYHDIRRRELGHDVRGWFPSRGWCVRFCKRWEITYQCRTNKHKQSIEERTPAIRAFHQYWLYAVQRSFPQRDPKYGRFPRNRVYAMDQVPFSFSGCDARTMNEKGAPKGCWLIGASEDDKRFLSLQVTLCGDPRDQDCPLEIIFRSDSGGAAMSEEEHAYYAQLPDLSIKWQSKAWADSTIIMDWLMSFRRWTLHKGEVALLMDNLGSQRIPAFRVLAELMGIELVYTPANCTDCVSPVDRNVGKWLKTRAYQLQDIELEANEEWSSSVEEGGLTKPQKRMLCAKWLNQAWQELKLEYHLLDSCFVDTGVCVACDGSEEHMIRLRPKDKPGLYVVHEPPAP
jgi:hypothetical protein